MYGFHDSSLEKGWCGWFGGMVFVTPVPKNRPSTLTGGLFGSRVQKIACFHDLGPEKLGSWI